MFDRNINEETGFTSAELKKKKKHQLHVLFI